MEKELSAYKQNLGYQTESLSVPQTNAPFYKRYPIEFNRNFQTATGISFFTSANISSLIDVKVSLEDDHGIVISPVSLKYMNSNPSLLQKNVLFRDIFRRAQGATAYLIVSSQKNIPSEFRLDVTFKLENGVSHPGWEIDYQQVEIALPTEQINVNYPSGQNVIVPKENNIHIQQFTFDSRFSHCIGFSSVLSNRLIVSDSFIQLNYQNEIICNKIHNAFSLNNGVLPYSQSMFPINFVSAGKTIDIEIEMKERNNDELLRYVKIDDSTSINQLAYLMSEMESDLTQISIKDAQLGQFLRNQTNKFLYPTFYKALVMAEMSKDISFIFNNTYYLIFLLKRYVKLTR